MDHAKETEVQILSRPHSQGTSRNINRTRSMNSFPVERNEQWKNGKCVEKLSDRSYLVQTPKDTLRVRPTPLLEAGDQRHAHSRKPLVTHHHLRYPLLQFQRILADLRRNRTNQQLHRKPRGPGQEL